jgi:predicted phage terminase large subunit-like protein
MAVAKKISPKITPVKDLNKAERSELIQYHERYQHVSNEWIKRQVIQNNRIDILATEVLGYEIHPHHMALLQFQFTHPDNLQLVFRGAGKSTVCTITKAIHLLLKNPNLRIVIASKTASNAKGFLKEIKGHFETNERLAEIFGEYYDPRKVSKWDDTEIEVLPRTIYSKEASITCVGVEGTIVSKHYDVILADDLVDEDNARTEHMREKTRVWYYQTLDPTLEPPDENVPHRGEYHRLGTRYHYADLYGHLSANELKEHTQVIPALKNGQSPWPDKYPSQWFAEKRKKAGLIIFNAQYQCHSENTEFLTEAGWKLFGQAGESNLATVDVRTGKLEYQKAVGSTNLPFKGDLLRINSYKLNALVTPNHRMLARQAGWTRRTSPPQGPWKLVEAQEMDYSKDRALLYSGATFDGVEKKAFFIPEGRGGRADGRGGVKAHHPAKDVPMDAFVKFLGYFISEGSTSATDRGGVRLGQNEGATLESMKTCFKEMGFTPKENGAKNECHTLDVRHIGFRNWLRKEVKTHSSNARIPRFVFSFSNKQLRILLNSLVEGDGHVVKNVKSDTHQYSTISKQLADDVQELATLLCFDASLLVEKDGSYSVCIRRSIGNGIKEEQVTPEPYVGNVVCFQVPNSTLITRLGGKVLVSGNCDTEAMKGEVFRYEDCQIVESDQIPAKLKIFMGIDLAISQSDTADHFAIVIIGLDDAQNVYVLDFFDGQLRFADQTKKIKKFYKKYDPIRANIETNAYQMAKYQELKDDDANIRLRPYNQIKDKTARAWKLSSIFEEGRVFFKKSGKTHKIIEQLVLFPNEKKDLFDALDLAFNASKRKKRKRRGTEPGVI